MPIQNFRELRSWTVAKEIAIAIYQQTRSFPKEELFGLTSQMRRSAVSISSNIAEGFNRKSRRDFERFLYIALGSCAELESQVDIAAALSLISKETGALLIEKLNYEGKMLRRLIHRLQSTPPPPSRRTERSAVPQYVKG